MQLPSKRVYIPHPALGLAAGVGRVESSPNQRVGALLEMELELVVHVRARVGAEESEVPPPHRCAITHGAHAQRAVAQAGSFLSEEDISKFAEFKKAAINNSQAALTLNRAMMAPLSEQP